MRVADSEIGGKYTLAGHEEKKRCVCVSTMNQDEGEQKDTLPVDDMTKGGSEDSKQKWRRTKAHTS